MRGSATTAGRWTRAAFGTDPVRRAIYAVGLIPAIWTFYLGLTDALGADPQKTLERTLGLWALRFLIIGLAISPLRQVGGPNLIRWRRAVGLLAFYYAAMHLSVYMLLDQGLDWTAIWADIHPAGAARGDLEQCDDQTARRKRLEPPAPPCLHRRSAGGAAFCDAGEVLDV
jgi:hypothetical protein